MRNSVIKSKFRRNQPALITTLHFVDPSAFEMTSLMGFDGIWMDLEHHAYSVETAATLMRAARVGTSDIVTRPAKGEFMRMARLLEAGATGIMYPRCESAAEAAEVVKWAKFAPPGERGMDGANADMPYCALPAKYYLEKANAETLVIIQIESPRALAEVEAIAAVPGVDVVMIGPGDLSVLSGWLPFDFTHPRMMEVRKRVAAAAQKAGIQWGTTSPGLEHSRGLVEEGARFICHGSDITTLKRALEQIQEQYATIGMTFDNRLAAMAKEAEAQG